MPTDPGDYKLTTQVDNNARKIEEFMTYCGDQSHYKCFFHFFRKSDNSIKCWYYKFVGGSVGGPKEGFEYYKNLQNCGDFVDYCNVYTNQTTGVNQFNCSPLTELEVTGPGDGKSISLIIRPGTPDSPDQKKFCPKIVMYLDGATQNDQSRRLKAYVGFHKEEDDTIRKGI